LLRLEVAVAAVHGFVQKWHGGTPKKQWKTSGKPWELGPASQLQGVPGVPRFKCPALSRQAYTAFSARSSLKLHSCKPTRTPERQNALFYIYSLSLYIYINTLIIYIYIYIYIYPIYISYIYISCIYIYPVYIYILYIYILYIYIYPIYIYILYILYITYVKCVTNGYVMCTNKNAKYIYIYLPTFAIKLPQVLGLFPTHRTLDTHGAFGPT
jgi:hypothetical protein